jgi:hypothetical protein
LSIRVISAGKPTIPQAVSTYKNPPTHAAE